MKNLFKFSQFTDTFWLYPLLIIIFAGSTTHKVHAEAGEFRVIRGERPLVALATVPAGAFEENVLLIQFRDELSTHLEQHPPVLQKDGFWKFGIPELDQLNEFHELKDIEHYFLNPALKNTFSEKHQAWGFHLWYKLGFSGNPDIKSLVQQYQNLQSIAIAEPEYQITQIKGITTETNGQVFSQEELMTLRTIDPRFSDQWHYHNTGQAGGTPGADIDLLQAWNLETGNPNVVVAIIDDGIQFTHPDIYGNMWQGIGFNFVAGTANVVPGNHGTHVAGTISALSNNGVGVAGIAGGSGNNDGVRLMAAQVFTEFSNGGFHLAPIWAADNGAAISQNSWGYTAPYVYNQSVLDAIDYFNINGGGDAIHDGGITIFAAGNSNSSDHYYPAYYSGAFSVAATNNHDAKSYYSNYGTWIDISAPGGETHLGAYGGVLSTVANSGYAFFMGTSMACPHVAGVAALIVSHAYGQLGKEDVANILVASADDHYAANPGFIGQLGSGRLNACQALLETQNYLTGVLSPIGFSALAINATEISLTWTLNPENEPVMIAFSTTDNFGDPEPSVQYLVGETIPGGGTVLFSGDGTSFLHNNLEPVTSYYYKIWSFSPSFEYSTGRLAEATTLCPTYPLPLQEGFEGSQELPSCWVQHFVNGNISWQIGSGNEANHPPTAFQGSQNIYFQAQEQGDAGKITQLILPEMNLAAYDSVLLSFYFTNQKRISDGNTYQDALRIKFKPVAHADWQIIETFDSDIAEWTHVALRLPNQSSTYFLAFEAESGRGHGICVDEIEITGFGSIPVYNISASAGQHGNITPAGNILVGENANASFLIQAAMNYVIDNLSIDGEPVPDAAGQPAYIYIFENVVNNHAIHAGFRITDYNVQVNVIPAMAGTIEGSGSFPYGSLVTLMAIENTGFTFNRWIDGGPVSFDNPFSFNLFTNRNLIALFTPIIYTVTAQPVTPGSGTISGGGNFLYGTQVSLSFNPTHGHEFSHWLEDGVVVSDENPYIFTVADSRSLLAHHNLASWNILAVAEPQYAGIVQGAGSFEHGSEVVLIAIPNESYSFINWQLNGEMISQENPFSFIAGNHLNLTANFELQTGIESQISALPVLYPNPSSGIFTLTLHEKAKLRINDITGRIILNQDFNEGTQLMDLSAFSPGCYYLQLQSHSGIVHYKIIIQK